MNVIEISECNYKNYCSLDIVAFSFAYPGAQGEMGAIYMIDRDGRIYHANYCQKEGIRVEHIKEIIPVFEDIEFGVFDSRSKNEKWTSMYLGGGNHLLFIKDFYDALCQKIDESHFKYRSELFQYWPGFILGLLEKGDDHLTMRDIWKMMEAI